MKNKLLSIFLLLLFAFSSKAQQQTATFDDGSKVEFEVISDKFKDAKPFTLAWEGNYLNMETNVPYILGGTYYKADQFFITADCIPFNVLGGYGLNATGL